MLSVSQVIEQLLVTNSKNASEDTETICECSLGKLHYNSVSDLKYETESKCSKRAVCYFVAVEKHKARISTKEFLRHQKFKKENEKKHSEKPKGSQQTSLLQYIQ